MKNKTVLITGASSGIGEALAMEFAARGARLVLCARREERLARLVSTIESRGGRAIAARCDVNREGDVERAVQAATARFGALDVAVANAGFGVVGAFSSLTLEDYRRQFETNVFGLVRTVYAVMPALKRSKGRLAFTGSITSYFSAPASSAYSMSKFAVRALAEALEHELRPAGVSVTLLSPGLVVSELRKVDNAGVFHARATTGPTRLHMPADVAARKLVGAIACRRREIVITAHGKILVFLAQHMPFVLRLLFRMGLKGRGAVELPG